MLRHALLLHVAAASTTLGYVVNNGTSCYVYLESLTHSGQLVDDTPSMPICRPRGFFGGTNVTFRGLWTGTIQWPGYIFPYTLID
jgi:hypothetical protein